MAYSERHVTGRCFNVQWPITSLHCFLSKASRSLDSFSEGISIKSLNFLIPGALSECPEGLSFSHSLTLSLPPPTQGETETSGLGPRNGLFDLS
jgi:hypothetical protein